VSSTDWAKGDPTFLDPLELALLMVNIHQTLGTVIALYLLICAGWGTFNGIRGRPASDSFRSTLLIAEGLFVLQAVVGMELLGEGKAPAQPLHFLYGVFAVVFLPVVVGYVGRGKKRESLWFGLATLFLFGIALRAITTGR
jgi:hypothetical protein